MRTNPPPFFSKKQLISIALILSFCLSTILFIPPALAVDYEWIIDGGFENYVINSADSCEDVGYWYSVGGYGGTLGINTTYHAEGSGSVAIHRVGSTYSLWDNVYVTDNTGSGDVVVGGWVYIDSGATTPQEGHIEVINYGNAHFIAVWANYNSGWQTIVSCSGTSTDEQVGGALSVDTWYWLEAKWNHVTGDVTGYCNGSLFGTVSGGVDISNKDLNVLRLATSFADGNLLFDYCRISDSEEFPVDYGVSGQLSDSTEPWFTYWYLTQTADYIGISNDDSYSGSFSAYLRFDSVKYSLCTISQKIPYLTGDNITNLSLYAKTTSTTATNIRATLYYSDGFVNFINSNASFTATDGWVFVNYTLNLIPSNKFLTLITFGVVSGDNGAVTYIDDVSLLANVETTTNRFEFYLIPAPQSYWTGLSGFLGYTNIAYVFHGTLFDSTGYATESGTFSVTSSFGLTTTSGTITNGAFQFNISPRDNSLAYQDAETFYITLTVSSGTYNINIYATWALSPFVSPPPTSTGAPPEGQTATLVTNFIIYFVLIFMPSILLAMEFRHRGANSIIGFFIGLTLCSAFCFMVGLIPIWFIFLDGLILVVVLLMLLGRF